MPDDITRLEIYAMLEEIRVLIYLVCTLVIVQVVIKIFETARVVATGKAVREQLARVGQYLDLAAIHGKITDEKTERISKAAERVEHTLAAVAPIVAQQSSTELPIPPLPNAPPAAGSEDAVP